MKSVIRGFGLAAIAIMLILFGPVVSTSAQEGLIEDQVNDPTAGTSYWCPVSGTSLYQSFTPSVSPLAAVELRFRVGGSFPAEGADTSINIRSDSPTGAVLGTSSVTIPAPQTMGQQLLVLFDLSPDLAVTTGNTYVIEWPSLDGSVIGWMGTGDEVAPNPYTGGSRFGCSQIEDEVVDLNFKTYTSAPTSLLVTNTNDSGVGSLRQALLNSNAQAGVDDIEFDIPGTGPHKIQLLSALPTITEAVTMDGTTEPDFAGTPVMVLDGSGIVDEVPIHGLHIDNEGSVIRGLVISGFPDNGILIEGTGGNTIAGNFIGTDVSGTTAVGNGFNGVQIIDSAGNTIGGSAAADRNIISGNSGEGVRIDGALSTGNVVESNYIGTDLTGTVDLGNALSGIYIRRAPSNSVIGNLVSGNDGFAGIAVCGNLAFCGGGAFGTAGSNAATNKIQGNRVGTDAAGTAALGNSGRGVSLDGVPSTTVGGASILERNVISANGMSGVAIFGSGASNNHVLGNFIGTDGSGTVALGNSIHGVQITDGANNNTIGGTEPGAGNVISGNDDGGVGISGSGTTGNVVQGNRIGTDITGKAILGNAFTGVFVADGATNNVIGGAEPDAGNVISDNGAAGVVLDGPGVTGNLVAGNFIGTDIYGISALPNSTAGVWIVNGAANNTIGGPSLGARNIISGNDGSGISILVEEGGPAPSGNNIQGNFIGTDVSGTEDLGNGFNGVDIINSPNNAVESNTIAYNEGNGVLVVGTSATGNALLGNSIHSNALAGIENAGGGNAELATPVITEVLGDRIVGTAPPNSRVEVFADAVNEGQTFLGSTTADSGGNFMFSGLLLLPSGPNLTATATDSSDNTSEFSQAVPWMPDNCELNDTWSAACDVATELGFGFSNEASFESWISGPGDIDWFEFRLPGDTPHGSLITFSLAGVAEEGEESLPDLPANFDFVVFAKLDEGSVGSSPIQGVPIQGVPIQGVPIQGVPIQGVPIQGVPIQGVPIQGVPIQGVPIQGVPIQGVPIQGVPIQGVPIQGVPIQGVGFHAGNEPEQTSTLFRSGMTGRYYVLVWSSTGEFSTGLDESPYEVTVSVDSVTVPACTNPTPTYPAATPTVLPVHTTGSTPQTLIVINRARMAAYYDGAAMDSLQGKLNDLAARPEVEGTFLDLGASPQALQDAYNHWDANACDPEAANELTLEVKKEMLPILTANPSIGNLVIVGHDLIIPFRRVPDNIVRAPLDAVVPNEFDYHSESNGDHFIGITQTSGFSPTAASLRLQYFHSDDFYADTAPVILEGGYELSVPDFPLGRLVELPADIEEHIDAFLIRNGRIDSGSPARSLTTGYGFLIDAANAIDSSLAGDFSNDALILDPWQAGEFLSAYDSGAGTNVPDVTSANAHYDHFRFADPSFPAAGPTSEDFVTTAQLQAVTANIAGTLYYSIGCHVGFNFWDTDAPGDAGRFDWAQVLVGNGASLVGSWGFAYGDSDTIAYTEELMLRFTQNFGVGTGTLGESMVEAKRDYLLNQVVLDAVHEKIMMQTVFYGLPMWELPTTTSAPPSGLSDTYTQGSDQGLTVREYQVDVDTAQLNQVSAGRGDYFSLAGQTQAANYRPVQPQGSIDVSGVPGEVAHGVIMTAGSYSDIGNFDPVITMPSWTVGVPEGQFAYEGWDPYRIFSLAQLKRGDGSYDERLAIALGQFESDTNDPITIGTERLYDALSFDVYYNAEGAEFEPPIITSVGGGVSSNPGVFFSVGAEDADSTVVRVVVAYTEVTDSPGGEWRSIDLSLNAASGLWEGSISTRNPVQFFVQALDSAGNVGMYAGYGYFAPITISVSGPLGANVGEAVSFTATLPSGLVQPRISWEFGDGAVATGGPTVTHTYARTGEFTVSVHVTDAASSFGSASLNVDVPPDPVRGLFGTVREEIEGLDVSAFRKPGESRRETLLSKLSEVESQVDEGDIESAINKLQNDILQKMDGCEPTEGSPFSDKNDWIVYCDAQSNLQDLINDLISWLEPQA